VSSVHPAIPCSRARANWTSRNAGVAGAAGCALVRRVRARGSPSRSALSHRFASLLRFSRELWGVSFLLMETFLRVRLKSAEYRQEEGSEPGNEPAWGE